MTGWTMECWPTKTDLRFPNITNTMIRPEDICRGTTKSWVGYWSVNPEIRCRRLNSSCVRSSGSAMHSVRSLDGPSISWPTLTACLSRHCIQCYVLTFANRSVGLNLFLAERNYAETSCYRCGIQWQIQWTFRPWSGAINWPTFL